MSDVHPAPFANLWRVRQSWDRLWQFFEDVDTFLGKRDRELQDLEGRMFEVPASSDWDDDTKWAEAGDLWAAECDDLEWSHEVRPLFYSSFFFACYALLESSIGFLCVEAAKRKGHDCEADIRQKGMIERVNFLTKLNLIKPGASDPWQEVKEFHKVRDGIAHDYHNMIDRGFRTKKFCSRSYETMRAFFEDICGQLDVR